MCVGSVLVAQSRPTLYDPMDHSPPGTSFHGVFLAKVLAYLVRNRTRGPPLENNPEIPPSSRDEGLCLLHGLATNLATSLQTPQEA